MSLLSRIPQYLQNLSSTVFPANAVVQWVHWAGKKVRGLFGTDNNPYFDLLPRELMSSVQGYLDNNSLLSLGRTKKKFRQELHAYLTANVRLMRGLVKQALAQNPERLYRSYVRPDGYLARNPFATMVYEETQGIIITGDDAEYDQQTHPLAVWSSSGQELVRIETEFFEKRIEHIAFNPENNHLIASARDCLGIWQLERNATNQYVGSRPIFKLQNIGDRLAKRITYLHCSQTALFVAKSDNTITIYKKNESSYDFANPDVISNTRACDWLQTNARADKLFAKAETILKIYDIASKQCIAEIPDLYQNSLRVRYDATNNLLIDCLNTGKDVGFWDAETGALICKFQTGCAVMSLHFDSKSKQLFCGCTYHNEKSGKDFSKIIIYDFETKTEKKSFLTPHSTELYYFIFSIDYDSHSGYVLTRGAGLQFWDPKAGCLVPCSEKYSRLVGDAMAVKWDKVNKKLIVLPSYYASQPLRILDYSAENVTSTSSGSQPALSQVP